MDGDANRAEGSDAHGRGIVGSSLNGVIEEVDRNHILKEDPEEIEIKKRANAVWEKLNTGTSFKMPNFTYKSSSSPNVKARKTTPNWMVSLGLAPKKTSTSQQVLQDNNAYTMQNGLSEEAKRIAAAALSAVKESASIASGPGRGKIEVTEIRDFAGEDIEVKKLVDAVSKEAADKAKAPGAPPPSALDDILENIKKKPKLSVLDKTKKDWGEFKEEKGLEEELETYKKSSNQYLDRVSFLQRTELHEFERERDARLSLQAKRRAEAHDED